MQFSQGPQLCPSGIYVWIVYTNEMVWYSETESIYWLLAATIWPCSHLSALLTETEELLNGCSNWNCNEISTCDCSSRNGVLCTCITCASHVYYMCITCVSHVHCMCITCVSHVHHMCITCDACVLHVHHTCISCVSHVHHMCITCVSHVYHSQPCVSILLHALIVVPIGTV